MKMIINFPRELFQNDQKLEYKKTIHPKSDQILARMERQIRTKNVVLVRSNKKVIIHNGTGKKRLPYIKSFSLRFFMMS